MLKIKKLLNDYNALNLTRCHKCGLMLRFISISPVYCKRCKAELPDFNKLLEDIGERTEFYLYG